MSTPVKSDPEVAAASLRRDLGVLWDNGRPGKLGWSRRRVHDLTWILTMPGVRADGQVDPYCVRMRADWYPTWPPQVSFVEPDGVTEPGPESPWLPVFSGAPPFQFGFHPTFAYMNPLDGTLVENRQLVCFSHNFDYYISGHNAQPSELWQPGTHNVSATLTRLHHLLQAPHYVGPAAAREALAA